MHCVLLVHVRCALLEARCSEQCTHHVRQQHAMHHCVYRWRSVQNLFSGHPALHLHLTELAPVVQCSEGWNAVPCSDGTERFTIAFSYRIVIERDCTPAYINTWRACSAILTSWTKVLNVKYICRTGFSALGPKSQSPII